VTFTPEFYEMGNFVNKDFHRPQFVVDKWIPYGGEPCIFFGDPGHGKSFLCNTLIKAVADGEPMLHQFKTMQGRIVYCSFDMPLQMVQDRMKRLYTTIECPENVGVVVCDSRINIMKTKPEDEWMQETMKQEPLIVILDTLRKIHYMDENEQKTVTQIYGKLGELFGAHTTPLVIAHQRKFSHIDTQKRADQRVSGHYSWVSDSDFGVQVDKDERHNPTKVTLTFARVRHTKKLDPIDTQFDQDTSMLTILVTPEMRARELAMEHPTMPESDIAEILQDEGLCERAHAYRMAKKVLKK